MRRLAAALWLRVNDETNWQIASVAGTFVALSAFGAALGAWILVAKSVVGGCVVLSIFGTAFVASTPSALRDSRQRSKLALREAELDRQLVDPHPNTALECGCDDCERVLDSLADWADLPMVRDR